MEISDTFQITLKLGGQNFSITIRREEELFYRDAEKLINQRYSFYANRFAGQSVTTYLLMTVLDIAVTLQKQEANGNLQPIMATLNGLINEVNIDQDNGNQMQLTDQGYDAALDGIFQFPDGSRALELTSISDPDDPDLRNYRFGLTFSTTHSESNFNNACWVGGTGAIDHVDEPSERQFYYMADTDHDGTPDTRENYSCWPTSIISAVGTGWSQTGGFISLPIEEGHGVVPTLQFTLTYDKRLTTTITRDVVFVMDEYRQDGTYVGPVNVTVTISTVIKNFSDLE